MTPGARLGPYEIVAALGAGGMGEVYRARDTRLGREVAVKVLPAGVAPDPERVRRFEHEARAAAALNHPNILVLYDVGEHDGAPFLVTELLEGESLRSRIARGPLPVKEAVALAVQLARGLAAAHAKGIVHRDLKPENAFVTGDGTVKILDFGLASLMGPGSVEGPLAEAKTETGLTRAGTVLGTAGYMAPEQVRGLKVDHRADIFAFGCVLYELLAGKRAFRGDTSADTLGAILREEPVGVETAVSGIPPALAQLVRRCLEKRPEERFSSAHDLALALQAAVSDVDTGLASAVAAAHPRRRKRVLAIGAGVVAALAAAGAGLWLRGRTPPAPVLDPYRVFIAPFENLTGDRSFDHLGRMAAEAIGEGLAQIAKVEFVTAERADATEPAATPTAAWRATAAARGAGTLVLGAAYLSADALELRAQAIDNRTGEVIAALDADRGPRDDPRRVVSASRERVLGAIAWLASPIRGLLARPLRYEAFREFEEGMMASGIDRKAAGQHFRRVIELEPACWMAYIRLATILGQQGQSDEAAALMARIEENRALLAPVDLLAVQLDAARTANNRVEALRIARRLREIAPQDFVLRWVAASAASSLNRPREALQHLGDLGTWDWTRLGQLAQGEWFLRTAAWSHHILGEFEQELEVAELALRVYPSSHYSREHQVRAFAALGRLEELERAVEESLVVLAGRGSPGTVMLEAAEELRAHGHSTEAIRMANRGADWYASRPATDAEANVSLGNRGEILWMAERWEEARRLAEAWSAEAPKSFHARGMVGTIAARLGDRATATALDAELAAIERPETRGEALFWRSAIAGQLGERNRSFELLREAFTKGLQFQPYIHRYVFLEPLHGYPPFEELIAPKG